MNLDESFIGAVVYDNEGLRIAQYAHFEHVEGDTKECLPPNTIASVYLLDGKIKVKEEG